MFLYSNDTQDGVKYDREKSELVSKQADGRERTAIVRASIMKRLQ